MNIKYEPVVSIIIPVFNEARFIERCLRSLLQNTYPREKIEILVVDGGSEDNTREVVMQLAKEDTRIILLDNPKKFASPGWNLGVRTAHGEVIVRFDGHAEAVPDFIERSVEILDKHPEAWCVGGSVQTIAQNKLGRIIAAAMSCPVGVGNAAFRLGNYEGYVDTLAFGIYRKEGLLKAGPQDENLVRNADDELNYRVLKAGGKIYMSREIKSYYYSRADLGKLWRQYFQYGFWRIPTILKHGKPATIRQIVPVAFIIGWIIFVLGALLWPPARYILAVYAGLYMIVLLAGGVLSIGNNGLAVGVGTMLIFPILHFSYGLGSLVGIWRFIVRGGKGTGKKSDSEISR
jgi:glycosyltransferase involved in cell wall biosynthesis